MIDPHGQCYPNIFSKGEIASRGLMNFDTLGEPNKGSPSSTPRKKRGVECDDALRWELMMLLSLHNTQERYVALLRANDTIDPTYLASEETYLAELEGRVRQTRTALGTDR